MTDPISQAAAGDPGPDVAVAVPATPRPAARPKPKKRGFLPTMALSLAGFLVVFEVLAFQMSSGNDPALGAGTPLAAKTTQAGRPVVNRKVVKTKVVQLPAKGSSTASSAPVAVSSGTGSSSAAAAPAPAPATAPAPAPAAAPVTSSS